MSLYAAVTENSPVLDVADVVALEQRIAAQGTPLSELMLRAGTALAECAAGKCPEGGRVLFICGSGNNGGDGWVAARKLAEAGLQVSLASPRPAKELRAEPARSAALETMEVAGERLQLLVGAEIPTETLRQSSVIVDCILGTGFDAAEVKEPYATWIAQANAAKGFKLACDAPSGLSAQSGRAASRCFRAQATITMLAVKTGLLAPSAREWTGEIYLAPLDC